MSVLERARKAFAKEKQESNTRSDDVRRTPPKYEKNELNEISPSKDDSCTPQKYEKNELDEISSAAISTGPPWDAARAAVALAECEAAFNDALTSAGLTPAQRNVIEAMRGVVRVHADRRDLLLWDDMAFLRETVAGWKTLNANGARAPSPAKFRAVSRGADWWATGDEADLLVLVKELFPPEGALPKVGDWRPNRPGGR